MRYIILSLIIILFVFSCVKSNNVPARKYSKITIGLDNFLNNYAGDYKGKKAAVVTNHSGLDSCLRTNINLLREKNIEIALILAPEHGLYGYQNEYDKEIYLTEDSSNAIVYNLHLLNKKKFIHLIKIADFVIFDMQDMGMRCYTYISSLKFIMDSLSGSDIELIVFDRPNPLGFLYVNGPFLEKKFYSKEISSFPAPLFYNMTIGEASLYYNGEYSKKVKLKVIPMEGYWRRMLYSDTKLPWVPPSPNLPTYLSSIIYSCVVLMEGINISIGRGTVKPFEYIGAPWIEPVSFCRRLSELNLNNFIFRPVYFEPTFSKYKGEKCGGVQIIYTGGNFDPMEISYKLISYIMNNYREFEWQAFNNIYHIDRLAGTDKFRNALMRNKSYKEYSDEIEDGKASFSDKRKKYLIYRDNNFPI
ncbi:MAG: DUF1343 domain-containing protein [Spirochaetota bacterium]